MAAKIKEGLRDIKDGLVNKFAGPKYADNLLGESLQDQLRKATAKDLLEPSEEFNSQVVDTINQDIANGKDSKDIVALLKKRLRTDNPQKQWLAVQLVGRVMRDCSAAIGLHTEELLQEVARVMARPARPESEAGKQTRKAAKELLRSYGRAGTSAFRAVNRSTLEAMSNTNVYAAGAANAANTETASVIAEVQMLIEQAQANTELLSEMIVAGQQQQGGAGVPVDEFENELTKELVTEVSELRGLFDAYLEQMQGMAGSGPEVEALMIRALEAVDMLDGALALHKDVQSNQQYELEAKASGGGAAGGAGATPAAAEKDLISLDDFSEALPMPPPVLASGAQPAGPVDPFAASTSMPVGSPPAGGAMPYPGAAAAPPAAAYPAYPAGAPAPAPTPGYGGWGGYSQPQAQQQQPTYGQPAGQQQPYMAQQQPPVYGGAPFGAAQPPSYQGMPAAGAAPAAAGGPANANNPFASAPIPSLPTYGTAGSGGGSLPTVGSNPFAGAVPAPAQPGSGGGASLGAAAPANSVDAEWSMFFAGRTGAAGTAPAK